MGEISPGTAWAVVAGILGAIILILDAAKKIAEVWRAAHAPDRVQDNRLEQLERRVTKVEGFLTRDDERIGRQEESTRISQQALLALLDHAIHGNNINQMQEAREAIRKHLINQ